MMKRVTVWGGERGQYRLTRLTSLMSQGKRCWRRLEILLKELP